MSKLLLQDVIKAQRQKAGLLLAFIVPSRPELFVCYPATEAAKAEWLAKAEKRGWRLA